jgi:hypothetical protein
MREILPGVVHWTGKHPRIGIEVSSHWIEDGRVAIDPLLPPEGIVVLSNRHHWREADRLVAEFGCPVLCPRAGLHEFEGTDREVRPYDPGDELPGGLVVHEVDAICPDDMALELRVRDALLFADGVVRWSPDGIGGDLTFVPDALMDEPEQTKQGLLASIRRLLGQVDFEHVLLAHGLPLVGDGREELQRFADEGGRTTFQMD